MFKIGDRVRYTGQDWSPHGLSTGQIGEVIDLKSESEGTFNYKIAVFFPPDCTFYSPTLDNFELVATFSKEEQEENLSLWDRVAK